MTTSSATLTTQLEAIADLEIAPTSCLAPSAQQLLNRWPDVPLVLPSTLTALSEVLTLANENHWPSIVTGAGSKLDWGNVPDAPALVISTQRLNRIVDHAVGDLTVTVEAGVTLQRLQAVLAQENQFLPLDPAYPHLATVGGIVATADAGSLRHRYNGVRDLLLGIEIIRADGQRAKAGGRVVKNVAGYDLMKLFTGSYGTLGAIAQFTFRTYPQLPAATTLWLTGSAEAIRTLSQQIVGSSLTPIALDLVSTGVVKRLGDQAELGLILKFATLPESCQAQTETITQWAQTLDVSLSSLTGEAADQQWQAIANLTRHLDGDGAIAAKLGVLPTTAVDVLLQLPPTAYGAIAASSGMGYLQFLTAPTVIELQRFRRLCEQNQGFLSFLTAPDTLKAQIEPWGYPGNALWLMQRLKKEFDPDNLLHPGCFVGGI